jgi:hypothetical protein
VKIKFVLNVALQWFSEEANLENFFMAAVGIQNVMELLILSNPIKD